MSCNIPLGFRFIPRAEELISGFLVPWVMGNPLPWNGIVYKALYGPDAAAPWDVFSDGDGCWQTNIVEGGSNKTTSSFVYVFTTLVRVHNRISRTAGGGTWGGQTGPKNILDSQSGETIGYSRMFSFEHPDSGGASSGYGHWIMHEYVFSERMLEIIPNAAAKDMVICKITRTFKNSGGGGRRRQPPQPQPQPQFVPPAIAESQMQFFPPAIADSQMQFFPPATADAQMQFFPPEIVEAGGSDHIQILSNKRVAEEDCLQEFQETRCKKQKSMGGGEGGGSSEAVPIPEAEMEEEKEDDALLSWIESVIDFDEPSILPALESCENNEVSCGGGSESAALLNPEAETALVKAVPADHDKGQADSDSDDDISSLFGLRRYGL